MKRKNLIIDEVLLKQVKHVYLSMSVCQLVAGSIILKLRS